MDLLEKLASSLFVRVAKEDCVTNKTTEFVKDLLEKDIVFVSSLVDILLDDEEEHEEEAWYILVERLEEASDFVPVCTGYSSSSEDSEVGVCRKAEEKACCTCCSCPKATTKRNKVELG